MLQAKTSFLKFNQINKAREGNYHKGQPCAVKRLKEAQENAERAKRVAASEAKRLKEKEAIKKQKTI